MITVQSIFEKYKKQALDLFSVYGIEPKVLVISDGLSFCFDGVHFCITLESMMREEAGDTRVTDALSFLKSQLLKREPTA